MYAKEKNWNSIMAQAMQVKKDPSMKRD